MKPGLRFEKDAWSAGYRRIAGVDEAGRGAWAGPVTAAAVILPFRDPDIMKHLAGLRDSKLLSPRQREAILPRILDVAVDVGISTVSVDHVVEDGIAAATRCAMMNAVDQLSPQPDHLLIDWVKLPAWSGSQHNLRKGDQLSMSIAAASVVAKVYRDREMVRLSDIEKGYGFDVHKGYGTRAHRAALERIGVSHLHRLDWAPFREHSLETKEPVPVVRTIS
ncbi:MAG: ribonuclease HII [Chloroflexota bacterium]